MEAEFIVNSKLSIKKETKWPVKPTFEAKEQKLLDLFNIKVELHND
jgi:hypothetical protein